MRYSEDIIEQVRSANDIVDVIGQYVKLTKKGANYFGLCPFHGEKTPSFSVSPQKQIYYCFGCGAGGNVISFLMEYENYSFTEALKYLAERAHIQLPAAGEQGTEGQMRAELRTQLYEVNREAALYYYQLLHEEAGRSGYAYFREKRALSDRTITHFGLGFAAQTPDDLYRYLKGKGYGDELLQQSGLCIIEERGQRDKFWNRVMFPIMDTNNRVVGFGGRVMGDALPKYLNSPETPIFDKSSLLYGLNFARRSRRNFLLLCEGYMDVIALHQAGFTNAVASLGTAFNEKHARLLKRYTDNVILTQDSDEAGVKAKLRAFPILRDAGLNVKVLTIQGCKDPDELIRTKGPDAYEDCIKAAKNAFLFEIDTLKKQYDLSDPAMKTRFYEETAEKLCMFQEPLERDNYVQAVSREQMIPYEELKQLVAYKVLRVGAGRQASGPRYDPDRVYLQEEAAEAAARAQRPSRMRPESSNQAVGSIPTAGQWDAAGFAGEGTEVPPSAFDFAPELVDAQAGSSSGNNAARGNSGNGIASKPGRQLPIRPLRVTKQEAALFGAERLLLSWFCLRPDIIDRVMAYLEPGDFSDGIFQEVAAEILRQHREGTVNAASVMDKYADDEEKRRQVGAILNADVKHRSLDDMSVPDLEKALSEAVRSIRTARLSGELASVGNDLLRFQELMREKTELGRLLIKL